MLQLAALAVGIIALLMGARAFFKAELQLAPGRTFRGTSARVTGVGTMLLGVGAIGFALVGMNILLDGWPRRAATASAPASPSTELAAWVEEITPDGQCAVKFPGTPAKETLDVGGIDLHRTILQREAGTGYFALTYIEMPAAQPITSTDDFLDTWRNNNLAAQVPGGGRFKLLKERKLEKDGVMGRQVDMQAGPDRVSLNRVFLSNRRVYRLNVVIAPALQENADVLQFLDSVTFKH